MYNTNFPYFKWKQTDDKTKQGVFEKSKDVGNISPTHSSKCPNTDNGDDYTGVVLWHVVQ
jgi:hypothetical protein